MRRFGRLIGYIFTMALVSLIIASPAEASDPDIQVHDLFEFEASIQHNDIIDGTEGFDDNDEPGNDSGPNNRIVRSWDTITYPVKMTVNPKQEDHLENIKIKLSGSLHNGISNGRVQARFDVGSTVSMEEGVTFEREYTIERTGSSVMVPVTVEVLGAKHGVELTPDIHVQVISVDGESIEKDDVIADFEELPAVTTSAKVNLKAYVEQDLTHYGIPSYPYQGITGNEEDRENVHQFSVVMGVDNLPGKSDIRGSTFPDPDGKIHYSIDLSGKVSWDDTANGKTNEEKLNFKTKDTPFVLFDHQAINDNEAKIGSANTWMDGKSYTYPYPEGYPSPYSKMTNTDPATIKKEKIGSVWDAGEWHVDSPSVSRYKVSYSGYNTDYVIGSTFPTHRGRDAGNDMFSGDKIFSVRGFQVLMPNEYRIGGPNNPNSYRNTVTYRASVTLDHYEDAKGEITPLDAQETIWLTERNLRFGTYAVNNTFLSMPGKEELGTSTPNYKPAAKGDASTITGENVYFFSAFKQDTISYGGYRRVYRWNTDAFELTERYAELAAKNIAYTGYMSPTLDTIRNNEEKQQVLFGVADFQDFTFESFTGKGWEDYTWYDTYEEAVKHGPIGAIQDNVTAPTGANKAPRPYIPLRVKHENIGVGARTKDGTENIAVTNVYVYADEDRKYMRDVTADRNYKNPAIWNENGKIERLQDPRRSGTNFETLAVVPALTNSSIQADKSSYYNSDRVQWTVESGIKLPSSGVPSDLDTGVKLTQTLPKGLTYQLGSGKVGDQSTEPEITQHKDGTATLTWDLLVDEQTHAIKDVTFATTINPKVFTSHNGSQSSLEVTNVIASDVDGRPENQRTSSDSITVFKVGMVGIYETINKLSGDKNSDFTVTLSPYTTIEDEMNVTGLTKIPLSGDEWGSDYQGTATIQDMEVLADRVEDEAVTIYLNNEPVTSNQPHDIDPSKNGWYVYEPGMDISRAVSLLFTIDGRLTNQDDIDIRFTIQTAENAFGDQYWNQTVINSDTDYNLSPVSNRVRYQIRADLELALERFRIYTDQAEEGLPSNVRVKQTVLNENAVKDLPITLAIYDKESGEKVTAETYSQQELQRESDLMIPSDVLEQATHRNYEIRIEDYDENKIWIRDGEGSLDTDGYTSQEKTLTIEGADDEGGVSFQGVIMTERELGEAMSTYQETFTVDPIREPTVTSGYGYEMTSNISYTNDRMRDMESRFDVPYVVDTSLLVDNDLLDTSLSYYDQEEVASAVPMERIDQSTEETITTAYQLPSVYLEKGSGMMYTSNQKENGLIEGEAIPAGHKLYVPVWIDDTGVYDVRFQTEEPLGVHRMQLDLLRQVSVEAYMFHHTDSNTPNKDELLIHSMKQEDRW